MSESQNTKLYDLIGTCGPFSDEISHEELFALQWMGIAYLNAVMGAPPAGCKLDVIWAMYDNSLYVTIALECVTYEIETGYYCKKAEKLIEHLSANVNWTNLTLEAIAPIMEGYVPNASG